MQHSPPVFVVGCPRSGTTFLSNLLSRHPSLVICGETYFLPDIYSRRRAFGDLQDVNNRRRLIDKCLALIRIQKQCRELPRLRDRLLEEGTDYREFFTCIMRHHAHIQGKQRFGEKTPYHAFFTETLSEWYPGAIIIHLVRDPRDVVGSLLGRRWGPKSVFNGALWWRLFNRAARRSSHRPGYLLVHYEHLAMDPENEIARICTHIGEPCDPAVLLAAEKIEGPYSWPRHASGPLTTERLSKWREQLTANQVSQVEWVAGNYMQRFGYLRTVNSVKLGALARGAALSGLDLFREQFQRLPYRWYSLIQPTELAKQEYWKFRHFRHEMPPCVPPSDEASARSARNVGENG